MKKLKTKDVLNNLFNNLPEKMSADEAVDAIEILTEMGYLDIYLFDELKGESVSKRFQVMMFAFEQVKESKLLRKSDKRILIDFLITCGNAVSYREKANAELDDYNFGYSETPTGSKTIKRQPIMTPEETELEESDEFSFEELEPLDEDPNEFPTDEDDNAKL